MGLRHRPLRYRGLRVSSHTSQAITRVWLAIGVGLLVLAGVLRASGGAPDRPWPIVAAVALLWAGGLAYRLRALKHALKDDH
jgi:hypothetical protein